MTFSPADSSPLPAKAASLSHPLPSVPPPFFHRCHKLDPGSYYFLELEAPQGYRLDEEKIDFTVHSGQTTEETVTNEKEEATEPEKKEEKDGAAKDPSAQVSPSPALPSAPAASPSEKTGDSARENSSNKKTGTLQVINAASGTGENNSCPDPVLFLPRLCGQ